ncbi:TraR/DksA C4-type zinc finger protein [Tissierella sp. MSJ-40]|uniref:TraR/DksA C4-type zinc finger protein n=1 Tax=Tissierella simiarum TaxID=2841534 RepID=A0ABS6EDY1_9FIRM|nr:TraR/DksA C4-type zinc finger protein [Tissierella simiarum]MBU5440363.1 TraR/DksA C4-type zinc finger protein [Tissierella simiarum]
MGKEKISLFKERLLKEKKTALETIDKMNNMEEYGSMDEYYSELSSYDNHPADIGTEVFMMEQDRGLKSKLNDTLYEIDNSLQDLEDGNYGICKVCGKRIDEERLELIPYLKTCIECTNEKLPLEKKMQFRPEEEDSISPFSKDRSEGNEFDREDSYQEVARYNIVDKDPSFSTGDDLGVLDDTHRDGVEEVENISQEYYDETKK